KSFVEMHTPPGCEIGNFIPRHGTYSVESFTDEAYNAPFILEQIVRANQEGYDVIVIDCACDPVLEAARELSEIPVIGPRNTAFHLALTLGTRFGVVTVQGESLKKCIEHGVRKEGLESFCAGVRYLKIPVLDIAKNPDKAQKAILEECQELITKSGADVIVLGCTALSHEVDLKPLMDELKVPIIDPWIAAVKSAFMLVDAGLSHSKIAYPSPPKKKINEAPSIKGVFDDSLKE
ncbi:MAG: aspartate/glutamate racemase family protein, partial [Promethearchaeota archaeon]